MRYLLILTLMFTLNVSAALAEEDAKPEKQVEENPITKWVTAEKKFMKSMPRANQEVFFVLRNKHNVIRTIEIVHRDVAKAAKACGKENEDIKKPINARLKSWEKAVLPILKTAEKFLETELKDQDAFHVSDYRHVTELNDEAFEYSDAQVEKQIVTTPEACQKLLESMDRTEDELVSLLQEILLPEEVIRKRVKKDIEKEKE